MTFYELEFSLAMYSTSLHLSYHKWVSYHLFNSDCQLICTKFYVSLPQQIRMTHENLKGRQGDKKFGGEFHYIYIYIYIYNIINHIHIYSTLMLCHRDVISNRKETSCPGPVNPDSKLGCVSATKSPAD